MDPDRFDALSRWLAFRCHRRALVGGTVVASTLSTRVAPSPVAAGPRLTAICNPAGESSDLVSSGDPRYAATFVAGAAGKLNRAEILLDKIADSPGDFVVKLLAVDPDSGVPTSKVLASRTVPADRVPVGTNMTLVASFKRRRTTRLVQGKTYTVVVSRPKANSSDWAVRVVTGNPCTDSRFFISPQQSGPFVESVGNDLFFTVIVGF